MIDEQKKKYKNTSYNHQIQRISFIQRYIVAQCSTHYVQLSAVLIMYGSVQYSLCTAQCSNNYVQLSAVLIMYTDVQGSTNKPLLL